MRIQLIHDTVKFSRKSGDRYIRVCELSRKNIKILHRILKQILEISNWEEMTDYSSYTAYIEEE